jgi:hypothetical protein
LIPKNSFSWHLQLSQLTVKLTGLSKNTCKHTALLFNFIHLLCNYVTYTTFITNLLHLVFICYNYCSFPVCAPFWLWLSLKNLSSYCFCMLKKTGGLDVIYSIHNLFCDGCGIKDCQDIINISVTVNYSSHFKNVF